MDRRYKNRVDVAMPDGEKQTARQFGVQQLQVTELSPPTASKKSSSLLSQRMVACAQKNRHKAVKSRAGKKKIRKGESKQTLMAQMK